MSKVKLGDYDVVNNNYDYILLARENGFFQDGWDLDDIATCSDWVVAHWIDELGEKKFDKERFEKEILPTFERWQHKNKIDSTGVGRYYDFLKRAELNGIKIDKGFFDFVSWFNSTKNRSLLETRSPRKKDSFEGVYSHFTQNNLIETLKRWKASGTPLIGQTAQLYSTFSSLESQGENINFDTFIFFYTLKNKLFSPSYELERYWDEKKDIEEQYRTKIISGDEFTRLNNWIYQGYNIDAVERLEKRIENDKKHLARTPGMDKYLDKINRHVNHDVQVTYTVLNELGTDQTVKLRGTLKTVTGNSITISYRDADGEEKTATISNSDNSFIKKINLPGLNSVLYEDRTVREKIGLALRKKEVARIKNVDIVHKYMRKYGSITGLAYLQNKAGCFIDTIEPEKYPINNLFTYCFEQVGSRDEKDIRRVLYAYNEICSGNFKLLDEDNREHSIIEYNNGYPITEYMSEFCQNKISSYCHYVRGNVPEDQLPPIPTGFAPTGNEFNNTEEVLQNKTFQPEDIKGIQQGEFTVISGRRR